MKCKCREEIKEAVLKLSTNLKSNRPLSEEELTILFLAAFFEEESNESK